MLKINRVNYDLFIKTIGIPRKKLTKINFLLREAVKNHSSCGGQYLCLEFSLKGAKWENYHLK
jgi:hypothetical protein